MGLYTPMSDSPSLQLLKGQLEEERRKAAQRDLDAEKLKLDRANEMAQLSERLRQQQLLQIEQNREKHMLVLKEQENARIENAKVMEQRHTEALKRESEAMMADLALQVRERPACVSTGPAGPGHDTNVRAPPSIALGTTHPTPPFLPGPEESRRRTPAPAAAV